jgi:Na+/H+ antiporter NhaD/arsenite permease-like protein
MRKKLVIYPYSFAQIINEAWYGIDRYFVANSLISVFVTMNIHTILLLFFGSSYQKLSKEYFFIDLIILIVVMVLLSIIYRKKYTSSFEFDPKKLKRARVILFLYFILTITTLIIVKENTKGIKKQIEHRHSQETTGYLLSDTVFKQ